MHGIGYLSSLFGKSREGYYLQSRQSRVAAVLTESKIVQTVKEIRQDLPGIGSYKLFLILREVFSDEMVGRDRFYALLQRHHLVLTRPRTHRTTNSNHPFRKYSNIAKYFEPAAPNELWVADITYIATKTNVCYLHLITDAYSREIIGWVLSETLMARNTLEALNQAIAHAADANLSKLIHHSDRGIQYCSYAYTDRLKEIHAQISMTEDYCPTDNAIAERVNGIIKTEWLYRMERPRDFTQARQIIENIVYNYNYKRPHMKLNMQTPAAVRQNYTYPKNRYPYSLGSEERK